MRRRRLAGTAVAAAVMLVIGAATADAAFGPPPPADPFLGPPGTATMHGDAESSDSTPLPGVGDGGVNAQFRELAAACPTILQGGDGLPQALCTTVTDRSPKVFLLDPGSGRPLTSLSLPKGGLLGGVYAYLDNRDRMVMVDGADNLVRIGHHREGGAWTLAVDSSTPIGAAVEGHCGGNGCDSVASLMPDRQGRVWFATANGVVGTVDPDSGAAQSITLPGEHVDNSISTAPEGTAVTTDHATYLFTADGDGTPRQIWRQPYDRGPARKPGQLSWGSGASPTFFGPRDGTDYLAITDNAVPKENLIVYDTRTGRQICSVPAVDGTENSPIGSGNSVFVAGTYGYPYPALPDNAGPSEPAKADFTGGMVRIDVDGGGCTQKWASPVKSAAVPRLSLADGLIYTVARENEVAGIGTGSAGAVVDRYHLVALNAESGAEVSSHLVGASTVHDTLQMVGTIAPGRVQYQGTTTGLFRITPG
ncbi:hypothetical protein NONO_c29240 [Nocardia nova SH22a]|uniref:Secreted protein n=1 Tax=Nocardia nova SH22a TaxID=1415166 RepID=W5TFC3_9NOCA|nr:hypothetical protein [Nocardia nova]AHH17713.1 hypothetical protein NONO_c29240 [Nocardia nova SH22a]